MNDDNRKQRRNNIITFRLSDNEFLSYRQKLERSGLPVSTFFRKVFVDSEVNFIIKERAPVNYQRVIFYVSKSSNNLNQIAKALHLAEKKGGMSRINCNRLMSELVKIRQLMKSVATDVN
ncbi:plasmid mobilization protein [Klebsiella oxytoca]|uniref:plasmid mobilization protein n=1 Tax=Klebsiella oxytoca TaxID=571 RepID=UPI002550227A